MEKRLSTHFPFRAYLTAVQHVEAPVVQTQISSADWMKTQMCNVPARLDSCQLHLRGLFVPRKPWYSAQWDNVSYNALIQFIQALEAHLEVNTGTYFCRLFLKSFATRCNLTKRSLARQQNEGLLGGFVKIFLKLKSIKQFCWKWKQLHY